MASLPIATPASFTPCSKPHSHHGRLPSTASVSCACGIVRYWQRTYEPIGWRACGTSSSGWASWLGRSLFLPKTTRGGPVGERAASVSQLKIRSGSLVGTWSSLVGLDGDVEIEAAGPEPGRRVDVRARHALAVQQGLDQPG